MRRKGGRHGRERGSHSPPPLSSLENLPAGCEGLRDKEFSGGWADESRAGVMVLFEATMTGSKALIAAGTAERMGSPNSSAAADV